MNLRTMMMMAVLSLGGGALAQQAQEQMQGEQKELTGKVLSSHEKELYIQGEDGAAVPIRITHQTELEGKRLKKDQRVESHLKKEFRPGEEVRTSFTVRTDKRGKSENLATSVEKQQ